MKTKVCGLKYPGNIKAVDRLGLDFMGFIFYPKSPRYPDLSEELVAEIRNVSTKKVGVFVNASIEEILDTVELFKLNSVQLHGDESPEMVSYLAQYVPVIKVFGIEDVLPNNIEEFVDADYLLFDTKGPNRGGNGTKFNWEILNNYHGEIPFLLSGGIHLKDVDELMRIDHPMFAGFDVNSGFELKPGEKNIELLRQLKQRTNEVFN